MKKIFLTVLLVLGLAGCATTLRYQSYTPERFPPKSKYFDVAMFYNAQHPPASAPYTVIGQVDIEGYASDGVSPGMLRQQAGTFARKRGADAIINVKLQVTPYSGTYVVPGHYGYYHYHPARYIPYGDTFLSFSGDLIIFTPAPQQK